MKRTYITGLLLFILVIPAFSQASTDFIFFGNNRACLPGLELMNSIFSVNPAQAADAVHNSLSFSTIFYPVATETGANPVGLYYSLTIPNFTIVNITQTSIRYRAGDVPITLTKDLLGLQFALALQDFIDTDLFKLAGGISLYKLRDIDYSNAGILAESINFDLGFTASLYGLSLQFLIPNLCAIANNAFLFPDPGANLVFKLGSKIILDVDFELGVSTAAGYTLLDDTGTIDFMGEVNFRRYFLSNSLRTGVGLDAFVDLDSETNQIPVIRYHIAVSYTPFNNTWLIKPEVNSFPSAGAVKTTSLLQQMIQNLTFNFGTTMIVYSTPENPRFIPVLQLGITKFY